MMDKLDQMLSGLTEQERVDLFGGQDALKAMRAKAQLQDAQRRALALSAAALFKTPDGERVLAYLVFNNVTRFENVTALGLPMETAIQLHAARDGARELVQDLLRLIKEGDSPQQQQG